MLKDNLRGTIMSADGQILAYSDDNHDGTQTRIYPFGETFSHVVGYSSKGKSGIELAANYYLLNTGDSVAKQADNKANGRLNEGLTIYTTLDSQLQIIADEYLGNENGAVILTEVSTGKILAMVSHPEFDPNYIDSQWDSMMASNNSVLLNRVTQGKYPPGSTFKIISALEYYRENGEEYLDYEYTCNGFFDYRSNIINCYHGTRHGDINFETSFAKSCNSSFANIGMTLNRSEFMETLDGLLFNQSLPCPFEYNKSSIEVSDDSTTYFMLQTSIGQGTTEITPYHLNLITMAIANDGLLMEPYVIESIKNSMNQTVKRIRPKEYGQIITTDEAEFLQGIMKSVVEEGTATVLKTDLYTAAGKTGSAEFDDKGSSHAWFTGFAPSNDPEIAVTIIVEKGGSGGAKAAPLAKLLFDAYFSRM